MKRNLIALALGVCMGLSVLTGCRKNVDRLYGTEIEYINDTGYSIGIVFDDLFPEREITIDAHSSCQVVYWIEGSHSVFYYPRIAVITFDGNVSVTHMYGDKEKYHNMCYPKHYHEVDMKSSPIKYSFAFTELIMNMR